MNAVVKALISFLMSTITLFCTVFGINVKINDLDVDFSCVSSVRFISSVSAKKVGGKPYNIMQGGCTDGKYAYYLMQDQKNDVCMIEKYDIGTWKKVLSKEELKLDHGNDIAYNPNEGKLVVVHNAPNRKRISYVDPDTLDITATFDIDIEVYSITYNAETQNYAVGIAHGFDYAILDNDFNVIKTFNGVTSECVKQGMDSDGKYIYFILSYPNMLAVYDWEGNYCGAFPIDKTTKAYESENIFHIDGVFYIGYNDSGYKNGIVYKTEMMAFTK